MRTTAEAVGEIIEVDSVSVPDITPFIFAANELVTELCSSFGYSAERMELIERWLSAHFYAIRDPRVEREAAGAVSASYRFQLGLGLSQTTYGQQAMMLDTYGGMLTLNDGLNGGKKPAASVSWLGVER